MSHFMVFLLIAVILSIFVGRIAYRASSILGFFAFATVFIGVLAYGAFVYAA